MLSEPIDMERFQNAVHAWFTKATDLETVWRDQGAPQPPYPFASLKIISGPDLASPLWEQGRWNYDAHRAVGKQIELENGVPCSFSVSCQAYVDQIDARNPGRDARSYMTKAQAALQLETYQVEFFRPFNIALWLSGPVQDISALIDDDFVSRSNMDVTFGTTLNVKEYITWIEKVEGKSVSLGIDQLFG